MFFCLFTSTGTGIITHKFILEESVLYKFTILSATQDSNLNIILEHFFLAEDTYHKLIANVTDSQDLLSKTMQYFPDIILLDSSFCDDIFSLVDQIYANDKECLIVLIISSDPEADFLVEAIHRHVFDVITGPVTEEGLRLFFMQSFSKPVYLSANTSSLLNSASRHLFIYKDAYDDKIKNKSLPEINEAYDTFFKKGYFRGLIVKMDYPTNIMSIFENNQLRDKIILIIKKYLSALCYDIIFDKLSDGVYLLLNYSISQRENINAAIQNMFAEIKDALQILYGVIVTMCISMEYKDVSSFQNIKKEVFDARYFRIHFGTNRILSSNYVIQPSLSTQKAEELCGISELVIHNFQILDIPSSITSLKQFFAYAKNNNIIYTNEIRMHIRLLIDSIFELYQNEIDQYTSSANLKHEFIYRVNMAFSFERIQLTFLEVVTDILNNVSHIINQKHSKPVANAILYIEKNYSHEISLNKIAKMSGLTPTYFSALFKKETRMTLSNYLIDYRLNIAKQYLRDANLSISEIGASVGYPDVKYFGRLFKKHMNITPSKFRKLAHKPESGN